jgi:hypothetical protein
MEVNQDWLRTGLGSSASLFERCVPAVGLSLAC